MTYRTGSTDNAQKLLVDILEPELSNEGWTIHHSGTVDPADSYWLAAEPPSSPLVFHFVLMKDPFTDGGRYPAPHMMCYGSTSFDSSASFDGQPGSAPIHLVNGKYAGPSTEEWVNPIQEYHIFVTSEYAHVVIKNGQSFWRLALAGVPEKVSSTDLAYCGGAIFNRHELGDMGTGNDQHGCIFYRNSFWNGSFSPRYYHFWPIMAWADLPNWKWCFFSSDIHEADFTDSDKVPRLLGTADRGSLDSSASGTLFQLYHPLFYVSEVKYAGSQIMLRPVIAPEYVQDDGTRTENFFIAGWVNDVRVVNMNSFPAATEFQVGGETWMAFPPLLRDYTNPMGYAFRKSI